MHALYINIIPLMYNILFSSSFLMVCFLFSSFEFVIPVRLPFTSSSDENKQARSLRAHLIGTYLMLLCLCKSQFINCLTMYSHKSLLQYIIAIFTHMHTCTHTHTHTHTHIFPFFWFFNGFSQS